MSTLFVASISDGVLSNSSTKQVSNFVYSSDSKSGPFLVLESKNSKGTNKISARVVCDSKNDSNIVELNAIHRTRLNCCLNEKIVVFNYQPPTAKMLLYSTFSTRADKNLTLSEIDVKNYFLTQQIPLDSQGEYVYKTPSHRIFVIEVQPAGSVVDDKTQVVSAQSYDHNNTLRIDLDVNFQKLGIGGLKNELDTLFRRFFLLRMFHPSTLCKFGVKPVKGLILYGPPGCGKTLIARNIGKSLNCKISIINGPEILNKYVGESESNLRKPFEAAKKDLDNLHLIIFDEIDSICRKRGSTQSSVGDTVVNQLLTLMDGVDDKNFNILVIGLTNRIDMLDEALLRPNRFEAKIHIPLPNYQDRLEILKIHTQHLIDSGGLKQLNSEWFASETQDFSGADIEGLVRNAVSFAALRNCVDGKIVSQEIQVTENDFKQSLMELKKSDYNFPFVDLTSIQLPTKSLVSILILGNIGSGKTNLALNLGHRLNSNRTVKLIENLNMNRREKDTFIIDSFRFLKDCSSGCLILDNLENIIEFNHCSSFNNLAFQSIISILRDKPESKSINFPTVMIIVTSSDPKMIQLLDFEKHFDLVLKTDKDFSFFQNNKSS